ncbi:MAG TPA: enoyl-CoA hydratase-related protein [Acidimicrobiales bacterium]|nr:enoyl-CoA hydratase-related protein [Acidimicrobiales bacterium]
MASKRSLDYVCEEATTLRAVVDSGILWVTMGGPESKNAMVRDAFAELGDLFDVVAMSDEVRVVVLRGGGKRFSTGGDVRRMAQQAGTEADDRLSLGSNVRYLTRMYRNMLSVDQPIVACVNGDAVGAGCTLALHCDIVLASRQARLGDPHVMRGLVASAGPYIWTLMTSLNIAKEYLLTGDLMTADEAWRVGLVNHVYEPDDLEAATEEMARKLASGAPRAIQWTKRVLNRLAVRQHVDLLQDGIAHELLSFGTADHAEGVSSFLERRDPVFRGH